MTFMVTTINLILIFVPFACTHNFEVRIHNGAIAPPGRYPYIVALVYIKSRALVRRCTGTVLRHQFILTAAHCVKYNLLYVQYGNMNLEPTKSKTMSRVLEMIKYPKYETIPQQQGAQERLAAVHDIAVLRVEPIKLLFYGKMLGISPSALNGLTLICAGFGKAKPNDSALLSRNQPLLIGEVVGSKCLMEMPANYIALCVNEKYPSLQHGLPGDSGGPLLYKDKVVGVLSQGFFFRNVSSTVYMSISVYSDYILDVISNTDKKWFDFPFWLLRLYVYFFNLKQ